MWEEKKGRDGPFIQIFWPVFNFILVFVFIVGALINALLINLYQRIISIAGPALQLYKPSYTLVDETRYVLRTLHLATVQILFSLPFSLC